MPKQTEVYECPCCGLVTQNDPKTVENPYGLCHTCILGQRWCVVTGSPFGDERGMVIHGPFETMDAAHGWADGNRIMQRQVLAMTTRVRPVPTPAPF